MISIQPHTPTGAAAEVQTNIRIQVNGQTVEVPAGSTIREAVGQTGEDTPTLCFGPTLTPPSACRLCVVEVEGSRTLVPACSRAVEPEMSITTNSERVTRARRVVLELLAGERSLDRGDVSLQNACDRLGVDPERYMPASRRSGERMAVEPDRRLFVRDYDRCVLCFKCTQACGDDHQFTFAISVAGRGANTRISVEFGDGLADSACVYCGNCVAVCPTGALIATPEFDLRESGRWDESKQSVSTTVCGFCGVGCNLDVHTQDDRIFKVTAPADHDITNGNLCIKGRYSWQHVVPSGSGEDGSI